MFLAINKFSGETHELKTPGAVAIFFLGKDIKRWQLFVRLPLIANQSSMEKYLERVVANE